MMLTLDEIGIKHGTDKATKHPNIPGHGYTVYYDYFFHELRCRTLKFLEIGVGGGESIRMWLEYFDRANIFGLDKVQNTNPWNTPGEHPDPRYTFIQGDQTDEVMWKCLIATYEDGWDIVIDDGGHFNDEVIRSFQGMWPVIRPGGLYCIEDLGVDSDGSIFLKPGWPRHLDWIKDRILEMNQGLGDIEAVHFMRELAVIRKKE